ncbi:AAA family ATPase [Spirillospora sp. CA-255316]
MRLVGRDQEFAALREIFTDCREGRGGVAVISGRVTTGKSALLHAFAEWAVDSGALFLGAVAARSERDVPNGVLEQLFRECGVPGASGAEETLWPFPGPLGGAADEAGGERGSGAGTLPGLWQTLRDHARRRPVVVAVDDVHFTDEPSQRFLLYLLRRVRSAPLMAVFTESGQPWHVPSPLQRELLRDPAARRLRLEALSVPEVTRLLSRHFGDRAARRLAPSAHRLSAGLPLLVRALIEDHTAAGGETSETSRASGEIAVGDAFGRAVLSLLYQHDPPVVEVARAAAVLDERASPAMLGRLAELDPASSAQGLRALTDSGLLSQGRFRHRAVREIVENSIASEARTRLHRRAAELLYDDGAPATDVTGHVITAGSAEDPWAVRVLREAAALALADDDLRGGIRHLRSAYRRSGDEGERCAIAASLARAEWRIDPGGVLPFLPELAAAARAGRLCGDDVHALLTYLFWHGRAEEVRSLIADVRDQRNAVPPSMTRQLGCWFSYFHPGLTVGVSPAEGERPPDPERTLSASVNARIRESMAPSSEFMDGDAAVIALADGILERSHLDDDTVFPLLAALAILMYGERLEEAASRCGSLLAQAEARHSPTWQALFAATHAMISLRRGDVLMAEKHAESALGLLPAESWGIAIGLPLSAAVLAATAKGDGERAEALLRLPVPDEMFHTPCGLHYIYARGWYYISMGRPQAALCEFELCGRLMAEWGIFFPTFALWRLGAAKAHLLLGDPERAARFVQEQLALTAPEQHRTKGHSLRFLAVAQGGDLALLNESVHLLENSGDRLGLAWTMAALSDVRQRLGESGEAKMLAFRAHVLAQQCGSDIRSAAGDTDEEESGGAAVLGELSDAQRRVAALAAAGYTNREISAKLHITVSTVEQHLTRVYRKLRVERVGLRWVFEGEGEEPSEPEREIRGRVANSPRRRHRVPAARRAFTTD